MVQHGEEKCGLQSRRLGLPPALEGAEDASCGGDLDDFARKERGNGHGPRCGGVVMSVVGEPACADEEDGKGGCDGGDESASEPGGDALHGAHDPSSSGGGKRVGEEITPIGAEKMRDTARGIRGEDWQAKGAFGEVENHREEAGDGAECHADEQDGEVLERQGDRRERKREGYVSAGGYEHSRSNDEEDLAGEGFLKRSGAVGESELGGDGGLHIAGPFVLETLG
jgi:hypothetical protein